MPLRGRALVLRIEPRRSRVSALRASIPIAGAPLASRRFLGRLVARSPRGPRERVDAVRERLEAPGCRRHLQARGDAKRLIAGALSRAKPDSCGESSPSCARAHSIEIFWRSDPATVPLRPATPMVPANET